MCKEYQLVQKAVCMAYLSPTVILAVSFSQIDRKRLMVWLIFVITLTTVSKVTSLHCSDQQLPASGDDDLQQVTSLQYCQVDNWWWILERNWTLSTLPIVSLLLLPQLEATPLCWLLCKKVSYPVLVWFCSTNWPTFSGSDDHCHGNCNKYSDNCHLLYEELRTPVVKLLILYNLASLCLSASFVALITQTSCGPQLSWILLYTLSCHFANFTCY